MADQDERVTMTRRAWLARALAFQPRMSPAALSLFLSVWFTLFYNQQFWREVLASTSGTGPRGGVFLAALFVFVAAVMNFFLTLVAIRYVQKAVAILLLFVGALAAFFMNSYGVLIDTTMIQNVIETDPAEVSEFLSLRLVLYVVALAVVPALILLRTRIEDRPRTAVLRQLAMSALASVVAVSLVGTLFYSDLVSLGNSRKGIGHRIAPANVVVGTVNYLRRGFRVTPGVARPLGRDAHRASEAAGHDGKTVVVLVLGETVRSQEFALNGYSRATNPNLRRANVVSFDNVAACGTSTAVSVPCMFSNMRRANYSARAAGASEGLLDVLSHAGIRVLWRDNNSGCKGVCDRVESQDLTLRKDKRLCSSGNCFDEILLDGLRERLQSMDTDAFVVLHQKGSHGPTYYLRYPKEFERFKPACQTSQLQECTVQEVVNAYDNTVVYTDFFVSQVIALLRGLGDDYRTAMLFVSDHGESLGERNLYLHGLPYFVAPREQTQVPFVTWFSERFERASGLDRQCLASRRSEPFSHDNLFHSVLGLMDVQTSVYEEGLDAFAACRPDSSVVAAGGPAAEAGETSRSAPLEGEPGTDPSPAGG